jgi:hypothetical protein
MPQSYPPSPHPGNGPEGLLALRKLLSTRNLRLGFEHVNLGFVSVILHLSRLEAQNVLQSFGSDFRDAARVEQILSAASFPWHTGFGWLRRGTFFRHLPRD